MLPLDGDIFLNAGAHRMGELLEAGPDYTVVSARNLDLGREEALKIFHDIDGLDLDRLREELRTYAGVQLCGLPRVLGTGEVSVMGSVQPVTVFERLQGPSLSSRLVKGSTLRPLQVVRLALQLLRVYDEVHQVGLAIGPLPADELVLDEGLDGDRLRVNRYHFGSLGEELTREAVAPLLTENPACVAPELFLGGDYSEPSDLFSVGVWMYRALVGRAPYAGSAPELMRAYRRSEQPLDWPLWAAVPAPLAAVVERALHIAPERRYRSAKAFAEALRAVPLDAILTREAPETQTAARRGFAPMSSKLGPPRPTIWAFVDGPEFRRPMVQEALEEIEREVELVRMGRRERDNWLRSLESRSLPAPHAVLFGDIHVLLEDPLLSEIADVVEASRVLISGHVNADLIQTSASQVGLDSFVLADMPVDEILERVRQAYQRAVRVRQRFVEAGVVRRSPPRSAPVDPDKVDTLPPLSPARMEVQS